LAGFVGPRDIFRNPESLFRRFQPTNGDSPFPLVLAHSGDDFAVMGMHFKIGLYEHQSAGGLQGVIDLLAKYPELRNVDQIAKILVKAYEPAFGIIGDPAKRNPTTRQSADHSMLYILSTFLRKAGESLGENEITPDEIWAKLMLMPQDYSPEAISNPKTRQIMAKTDFAHGGPEYDARYPDGIPTSVQIWTQDGAEYDSNLIMYPAGHARNTTSDLASLLKEKFKRLSSIGLNNPSEAGPTIDRLNTLGQASPKDLRVIYNVEIADCQTLD